jgi:hypothetical protein
MTLSLTGYVTEAEDKMLTLMGVPETAWRSLHPSYWDAGVCRRVSKDKKKCIIRVTGKTLFIKKNTGMSPFDMIGCYVKVVAVPKKYEFMPLPGVTKKGWTLTAVKVSTCPIPEL